ncbi:MAG: hypothetical protein ACTSV1_03380 [Alphaproteobacteria bacterium]
MMIGVIAISLPLLVTVPEGDLPYLPDDLCVDFTIIKEIEAVECPEYYITNPKTGSKSPLPMPRVIGRTLAELLNETIRSGLMALEKKSATE